MIIHLHWTYSTVKLRPDEVAKHEKAKTRLENDRMLIGGLDRRPIITHCITANGVLHVLDYCPGHDIHLALIGGLNSDYYFANTATSSQLLTLGNLVRFWLSMGEIIKEGDFTNFNFQEWIKGISK